METPFLDRNEPAPGPRKRRRAFRLLIGATAGAAIEMAALRYGWFDRVGQIAVAFFPCYYAILVAHEFGHLVAALAMGFRWREFAAGPLVIRRQARGVQLRLVATRWLAGGQVQAVPEGVENLRRRFIVLLAGGPLATALVFAIAAILPGSVWRDALIVANTLAAATSWLPYYAGGNVTDAKGMILLAGKSPEGDLLFAMLYVMALDTRGVRPRDWPASPASRFQEASATPLAAAAAVLDLARALDGGEADDVVAATERAIPKSAHGIPLHRRMIFESAAYVQGIYRRNSGLAKAWLDEARRIRGVVAEANWDADSEGAIAIAEDRMGDARGHFARALARLDRQPGSSGSVAASRERLLRLIEAAGAN